MPFIPQQAPASLDTDGLRKHGEEQFREVARAWTETDAVIERLAFAVTPEFVTPSWTGGDATVLLQTWLQYGVDEGVALVLTDSYTISGQLTIPGPVTLVGLGGVITNSADTNLLFASGVDDIVIRGLKLVGNRGTGVDGFYSAIALSACDDVRIQDNTITSFKGGAVFLTGDCNRPIVSRNKLTLSQYGVALFKGVKGAIVVENQIENIDGPSVFVDDATVSDTAGTAVQCENVVVANNVIKNSASTELGYAIGMSAIKGAIVSGNLIDGGGVSGSIVCTGIVINSGQANFNISQNVVISGNIVKNLNGGGAVIVSGAQDVSIVGNVFQDNYLWSSVLSTATEVDIAHDGVFTTTRIFIAGNCLLRTMGELDIGVLVRANVTEVHIGENSISGIVTPYQMGTAGAVRWHGIGNGTIPGHQAGFRGRIWVDDTGIAWVDIGTAWNKIGLQT